jgi:hypothetical protein
MITHFIYIPFTGLGDPDYRGNDWFSNRARVFKDYTLKSLSNQTNKNFIIWISFRPEDKGSETVKEIQEAIDFTGLKRIFTFDGIAMYDDRGIHHNKDLKSRLERIIETLRPHIKGDWVFRTDCGSDDMLSKEAIAEIQEQEPRENGATYYLNGYIFNAQTGQVADWLRDSSCSKYTLMFAKDEFLDVDKHYDKLMKLESHEFTPIVFDADRLPDGRYACTVHGYNISTGWVNSFRGEEYFGAEKDEIRKRFGLER